MQAEFLESAEFYNRRYHNFSSRVIAPTLVLVLFGCLFAVFATKEITVSAGATLEPSRVIASIQSTSNSAILVNHLEENKLVQKGDLLIQYQEGAEGIQAATYASQLDQLKDQKLQLGYLQASIEKGSNQFPAADSFGYQATFRDYLSQASHLKSTSEQQNASISSQNAATSQTQAELGQLISDTQTKLGDYQSLKAVLEQGGDLETTNAGYGLYQTYKSQGESAKAQILAQAEAQIAQLESTLAGYRVQYAGTGSQQAYFTGLGSQLESLKAQHLAKIGQELTLLDQKILEAESGKEIQGGLVEKGKITASEEGVLHLNPETSQATLVPEGTLLAQLYPNLTRERKVTITAYLSSKEMASVKVGDLVRFATLDGLEKQAELTSKITNIDTTATKTEKGNFFKLEAETDLRPEQAEKLRYGIEGRLVMITGKKTYLQAFLDHFLRKES